jgi:hypothetical protein
MGRRKRSRNPIAKIARIFGLVRLGLRALRIFRKVNRFRRVILLAVAGAVLSWIARRRRRGSAPEPMLTYSPAPTPTVTPGAPPLDAAEGNGGTVTERNLEAEKDA